MSFVWPPFGPVLAYKRCLIDAESSGVLLFAVCLRMPSFLGGKPPHSPSPLQVRGPVGLRLGYVCVPPQRETKRWLASYYV
jgi:hypothetical protein